MQQHCGILESETGKHSVLDKTYLSAFLSICIFSDASPPKLWHLSQAAEDNMASYRCLDYSKMRQTQARGRNKVKKGCPPCMQFLPG